MSWLGSRELPLMSRIAYAVMLLMIGFAFFFTLHIAYKSFQPYRLPDIVQPMPVEKKVVKRGEEQEFIIDYTKYDEADVVGTRTIQCEDGNLVTMTDIRTNLPVGSRVITSIPFKIPTKISLGMCKLVIRVRYEVNPYKVVFATYETEPFEVIDGEQ